MKRLKRGIRVLLIVLAALIGLAIPGLDNRLRVVRYTVESPDIVSPVRIALVTDLHSCAYGENERELIDAIDAEAPDIVLLGGDIFDGILPSDNTVAFLAGISGRYPCWYVNGNHEYVGKSITYSRKKKLFKQYGITRLKGKAVDVTVGESHFSLCGVDDPNLWNKAERNAEYTSQVRDTAAQAADGFTLLLAHRPEYASLYAECGFDLVLSGHTHGGQWRIPRLVNGLYAPNQGLFPRYGGGRYEIGDTTMIISRGLARESTWVPRLYNPPELVIVELCHGKQDTQ